MAQKNKKRSGKKKKKAQQVTVTRDWSCVPLDVLGLIASRLLVAEETIFRSICRTWASAPYRQLPPSTYDFLDPCCPWLFYFLRNESTCRVVNPLSGHTFNFIFAKELAGYRIQSSRDGWLVMERNKVNLLLFNPLTGRIINEIPVIPTSGGFPKIWFKFSTQEECTIVGFRYYGNRGRIGIWRLGERTWELHTTRMASEFFQARWSTASLGWKFYCLAADGVVGVFNIKCPDRSWTIWNIPLAPNPEFPCNLFYPCYLVETNGGALLGIFETRDDATIKIFKLNKKQQVWEQVHHLGNQTLFLSNGRCFSRVLSIKSLRNKIFSPKFVSKSNSYVLYCPTTKKVTSLDGEFSSSTVEGLKDLQHSCWFTPTVGDP